VDGQADDSDDGRRRPEENGSAVCSSAASASAGTASVKTVRREVIADEMHRARFSARENVVYHASREQFFSFAAKLLTGVQVLLGTSAIAMLSNAIPGSATWTVLISALVGVVLLVLDPSALAREHRIFRSRYHLLLAEMDEAAPRADSARTFFSAMSRIAAEEPPTYRAVQAMAYNAAVNAEYREPEARQHRYHIPFHCRLFAQFFPMRGRRFELETS